MPKFKCPHCSQSIDAPDDLAGANADCPACGKAISVPDIANAKIEDPEIHPPRLPKTMKKTPETAAAKNLKETHHAITEGCQQSDEEGALPWLEDHGVPVSAGEEEKENTHKTEGLVLMVLGALVTFYFLFVFSTARGDVNNLGLLNTKLAGVVASVGAAVIGSILYICGVIEDKMK